MNASEEVRAQMIAIELKMLENPKELIRLEKLIDDDLERLPQ